MARIIDKRKITKEKEVTKVLVASYPRKGESVRYIINRSFN